MTQTNTTAPDRPTRIGVAIAAHNYWYVLEPCLERLAASQDEAELYIVVFDDGSTDGTRDHLRERFPHVQVIAGDGTFWWTGGTNRAVELCLAADCDYILLLNPDVFVAPHTIQCLLDTSRANNDAVCAPVVADRDNPEQVVWAGSRWGRLVPGLPVWTSRYLHRRGAAVETVPDEPYVTTEVHGRSVLFPTAVFRRFGLPDDHNLPHAGGDTEYSLHLLRNDVPMLMVPEATVTLETKTSALGMGASHDTRWRMDEAVTRYWQHLTDQRKGNQWNVWWTITQRHLPWYSAVPSFAFIVGTSTVRFWQREMRHANHSKTSGRAT